MEKDQIFKENEIDANRLMTIILAVTMFVFVVTWILFEVKIFDSGISVRGLMFFNIMLIIFTICISVYFKFDKRWIKYILMGSITIVCAVTTSILTFSVPLFIVIPIILSLRYFSKRYTIFITIMTIIVFLIAYVYGANHGVLDLNYVQYPAGTTFSTNDEMWLDAAVKDTSYNHNTMIKNTVFYNYFGKLLQLVIIAAAGFGMVVHCQNMIQKQKMISEKSARIGAELDLARKIQADVLPNNFPAFPEREEFDLYASMTPAKEVGGDFYDFFMVDEDHLGLVIADVSGKGVPAAMFMMFCKNIIANNVMLDKSPAKALVDSNNAICANNENKMFVTVWVGILEISTGKLIAANAGHEYPFIRNSNGDFEFYKDRHGLVLGGMAGFKYNEYEIKLQPGSKIFVYTDGVHESNNKSEELFGMERLTNALKTVSDSSPKEILKGIRNAVDDFADGAEQFDDLTMLCLEYKGGRLC